MFIQIFVPNIHRFDFHDFLHIQGTHTVALQLNLCVCVYVCVYNIPATTVTEIFFRKIFCFRVFSTFLTKFAYVRRFLIYIILLQLMLL